MIIRYRTAAKGASKPSDLEGRLAVLEAAEAARSMLNEYAAAIDSQDISRLEGLLAHDVSLSIAEISLSGKDSVLDFFKSAFVDDPAPKSHFIMNVQTRWLGADGLVDADSSFLWTARETVASVIGWGTYRHQVRVSGGRAEFTRIQIEILHAGDLGDGWPLPSEA